MRLHLAAGLLAVVVAGGCYASTGVGYSAGYVAPAPVYSASVSVDTYEPDLVDVGGGVRVIADYDEPIFYTDNYYWRFYGGTWYRSNSYNRGWVVYNNVPYSVRRIDRPHAYVRYRPSGYVPRARRAPHARDRGHQPAVRDHRRQDTYRRAPQPATRDHRSGGAYRPAPRPAVRDHRSGGAYRPAPQPATRDHRSGGAYRPAPQPATRDHRSGGAYRPAPQPATRDHRTAPAPARSRPAPAPTKRDHRDDRRDRRR